MNPHPARRVFLKSAAALIALALPIVLLSQSPINDAVKFEAVATPAKKNHTITVAFVNGTWSYTVSPAQPNAKQVKVKRGDTLTWVSSSGSWTVFFKNGTTPLDDGSGNSLPTVSAASGTTNGGIVAVKHPTGAVFTYGVRLQLNGGGTVEDDPEIIID